MSNFDITAIASAITEEMAGNMASLGISDTDYQENTGILNDFNNIAAGMLQDDPGLEMPGSSETIPLDESLATQTIRLFSEGISFSMMKCLEMGISGDIKKTILQNMALEVYNQAKQIVACTYGQEHTPEFQFSYEQQADMINQSAEGHLMFFIGEYEKEHGPIFVEEVPPQLIPKLEQALAQEGLSLPAEMMPVSTPATDTRAPATPEQREKFAAVALLLTALPTEQRGRLLLNFSVNDKEWITYYSYPQHIQQELDIERVQAQLKQFQTRLKRKPKPAKSDAYKQLAALFESNPKEKLLSCVKDERPLITRYIESHYHAPARQATRHARHAHHEGIPGSQAQVQPQVNLPPRLEEILYRYLTRHAGICLPQPLPE